MCLYTAVETKRWFLAVFSMKKLHLYNKEKTGLMNRVVEINITSVDALLFIKRGQEIVLLNEKAGEIVLISVAGLNARSIATVQLNKISCTTSDEDGVLWCAAGPDVYILMVGYKDNTCLQPMYR
jgi:hypothetical protein